MESKELLSEIVDSFREYGLQVTVPENGEKIPYGAALVSFGSDDQDKPIVLQVLHYSQDIFASFEDFKTNSVDLSILSFLMTVPVEIPQKNHCEIMKLIALANKALPLGALNFSEAEHAVYYIYNIPILDKAPDERVLLTVLHTALFVKETFFMAIHTVGTGKATVDDLLKEADSII